MYSPPPMSAFPLPFRDLRGLSLRELWPEVVAAVVVGFTAVPQGVAYAIIAGLPPVVGLYASAIPTMVGSFFRSSRHVVTGPSNALSLLVGASIAGVGDDPAAVALTLALMVGAIQVAAGMLRLGAMVDFVSAPVVVGYITGAGVLIAVGQLHNVTGTTGPGGTLVDTVGGWLPVLGSTQTLPLAVALATVVFLVVSRLISKKFPGALLSMVLGVGVSLLLGLEEAGLEVVADQAPTPLGLPPLTIPDLELASRLVPAAVACSVLSLIESNAVARSIAQRTGQRIDSTAELVGHGLANVSAAFFGGYPVSGSLSRSALNHSSGAKTRMAGVFNGVFMIAVLLVFGPVVDHTPIASLAGLLLVVAFDLVDPTRIRRILTIGWADRIAFITTMVGTWVLPLDQAIYLGVGLSVIFYLRRARLLEVAELVVGDDDDLEEISLGSALRDHQRRMPGIRLLQVEGALFFGAAGELQAALDRVASDASVQVVVLRLRSTQGMDFTVADVLEKTAEALRERGRTLVVTGMRGLALSTFERSGCLEAIGADNLFAARDSSGRALERALERARALVVQPEPASPSS